MRANKKFTVLIYGLGLVGGSLAKALSRACRRGQSRELFPQGLEIWAAASRAEVLAQAKKDGVISRGFVLPHLDAEGRWQEALLREEDLFKADFVLFSTPVETIVPLARFFGARSDALLSDAGSVKSAVMAGCRGLRFAGGHPMAGSERTGYYCADEALFDHACYAFCLPEEPLPDQEAVADFLEDFAALLGARALFLKPSQHDFLVARVSHLPHITASALVNAALREEERLALLLSAGGFRDITRIASSDPALWAGISLESGDYLAAALREMIKGLEEVLSALERGDAAALEAFFSAANEKRARVPQQGTGPLVSDSQLLLNIEDKPGVLARLTARLSEAGINIHNLSIQDARQYEGGQVRIFISSPAEAARAAALLKEAGYALLE